MHLDRTDDRSAFLLQSLTEGVATTPSRDFFRHLTRSLATALQLRYCMLTECLDSPASRVRTLAFWDGERFLDSFEYELAGTPCRRVLGGADCRIDNGVRALFPDDLDLVDLAAESYAALPLLNTWGQVIGHLAVLDTRAFHPAEPDFLLMRLCAGRAGAELERLRLHERLVRAHRLQVTGQLAGGLVHDFNNVLTAIAGYSELMLGRMPAGDERRADAEEILAAAQRGQRLVEQLAAFQKRHAESPRRIDLDVLLTELEPRLRQLLGEDRELATRPGSTSAEIVADPAQIEQVLITLLTHAQSHTQSHTQSALSAGGRLTLATALVELPEDSPRLAAGMSAGAYVACSIDDGITGTEEALIPGERLFDPPFHKGEEATRLGLVTIYGIVREAGGNLVAETSTTAGTRFTMLLPVAGRSSGVHSESSSPRDENTVLVVEDRAEVRRLLARMLERGGYQVLSACDSDEALMLSRHHVGKIVLLITDVQMPGTDGWELGRQWREHQPATPILFISGSFDDTRVEASRNAGACDFLRKPFSSQKLLEKVGEILSQTQSL